MRIVKNIASFTCEMRSKIAGIFLVMFFVNMNGLSAQENYLDFFRSTGKINTVVAVIVILFMVLIVFLLRLELKLNKLEKTVNNEEQTG